MIKCDFNELGRNESYYRDKPFAWRLIAIKRNEKISNPIIITCNYDNSHHIGFLLLMFEDCSEINAIVKREIMFCPRYFELHYVRGKTGVAFLKKFADFIEYMDETTYNDN